MIMKASDRIGKPYVEVDADRIKGIIECNIPDEARSFKALDPSRHKSETMWPTSC